MRKAMALLKSTQKYCFDPLLDDPIDLPDQAGVYMIVAKSKRNLETIMINAAFPEIDGLPIIYVGISEKQGIKKRDYKNHFSGTARKSTVRKSLGSLFKWQANRIYDNGGKYRFKPECEEVLSKWMQENLVIYYWLNLNTDLSNLETDLINELDPPLNIKKNKSHLNRDFRDRLRELRN